MNTQSKKLRKKFGAISLAAIFLVTSTLTTSVSTTPESLTFTNIGQSVQENEKSAATGSTTPQVSTKDVVIEACLIFEAAVIFFSVGLLIGYVWGDLSHSKEQFDYPYPIFVTLPKGKCLKSIYSKEVKFENDATTCACSSVKNASKAEKLKKALLRERYASYIHISFDSKLNCTISQQYYDKKYTKDSISSYDLSLLFGSKIIHNNSFVTAKDTDLYTYIKDSRDLQCISKEM
jgi:hypothetical protein